jgi:hypothetical protein
MTCQPQSRTFSHQRDAEHIHADQQRETANSNGEIDLMHGDLSETTSFSACDSREPLLTGRCYPTHPITMGPFCSRSDGREPRKADGRYAADLFLQLPARGSGSAATFRVQPFDLVLSQNDYLGHGTFVSRYRTEGGSHPAIGMV